MVLRYWLRVFAQALRDTSKFMHLPTTGGFIVTAVIGICAWLASWFVLGRSVAIGSFIQGVVSIIPLVLIFFLLFAWHWLRAPREMENQNENQAKAALEKKDQEIAKVTKERDELFERQKPQLEIVYKPNEPPYQESITLRLSPTSTERAPVGIQLMRRIGIHNLSKTESVDDISVSIEQIEPPIIRHLPVPLRFMHGEARRNLNADETRFAEVFSIGPLVNKSEYVDQFVLHQAIDGPNVIPIRKYELMIVARCRNAPPASKRFVIDTSDGNHYELVET